MTIVTIVTIMTIMRIMTIVMIMTIITIVTIMKIIDTCLRTIKCPLVPRKLVSSNGKTLKLFTAIRINFPEARISWFTDEI